MATDKTEQLSSEAENSSPESKETTSSAPTPSPMMNSPVEEDEPNKKDTWQEILELLEDIHQQFDKAYSDIGMNPLKEPLNKVGDFLKEGYQSLTGGGKSDEPEKNDESNDEKAKQEDGSDLTSDMSNPVAGQEAGAMPANLPSMSSPMSSVSGSSPTQMANMDSIQPAADGNAMGANQLQGLDKVAPKIGEAVEQNPELIMAAL